jgi:magnesium-transporting ATPase (P-type)
MVSLKSYLFTHAHVNVLQVWRGTVVLKGVGQLVVTATGTNSYTGRITAQMKTVWVCFVRVLSIQQFSQAPRTPLQVLLKRMAKKLCKNSATVPFSTHTLTCQRNRCMSGVAALIIVAAVVVAGFARGLSYKAVVLTGTLDIPE